MFKKLIGMISCIIATNSYAQPAVHPAIQKGLQYLESVQFDYGELPTMFTPNTEEPARSLTTTLDSNLFTTAMLADAIKDIKDPAVERINKKAAEFIKSQLNSSAGLWSYFTSHNPKPLYPTSIYDLDDTAFASMVLEENKIEFPNNISMIKANRNSQGVYETFYFKQNDIDCGVNATVLSYLQENDPKVCGYLNTEISAGRNCANYYTQLDAYYLIARAYEGGISCLAPSVNTMTQYVLSKFTSNGSVENSSFKTAIALNTLLHLGYKGKVINNAVTYLLSKQSPSTGAWEADDFWIWAYTDENGNKQSLGRSSSKGLTTALVLKALNKVSDTL